MSFEELLEVPMIEDDKAKEMLFDIATNSYIIDETMIENLPATNVVDLLRYAPGMHITESSNGVWAMGIRGMDSNMLGRTAFMVDEVSAYSSGISSIDGQSSFMIEDVSSIEVVYGPGGGVWQENSANGMVNVVMKTAFETEGTIGKVLTSDRSHMARFRSGFSLGTKTSARVYGKYENFESRTADDAGYEDDWTGQFYGVRVDHRPTSNDLITASLEYFISELGYARGVGQVDIPAEQSWENIEGSRMLLTWKRQIGDAIDLSLKSWGSIVDFKVDEVATDLSASGVDFDLGWKSTENHSFIFGLGYGLTKYYEERNSDTEARENEYSTYRASFRHEWEMFDDHLMLTWGASFQDEDGSPHAELSPSVGVSYKLTPNDRLWFSWSLAAKSVPTEFLALISSESDLENEFMEAYELGYRKKLSGGDSISINTFYYEYDDVFGFSMTQPTMDGSMPIFEIQNIAEGYSYGGEFSWQKHLTGNLSFSLNYSCLFKDFDLYCENECESVELNGRRTIDELENSLSPHLVSLWLHYQVNNSWNMDLGLRHRTWGSAQRGEGGSTTQLDNRITWVPSEWMRVSIIGRNLLDEYTNEGMVRDSYNRTTEIPRSVDLEIGFQF